ncbi:hypothetical protein [Arthrobacter sp. RAF14]|uniref:hypothetical protein n=1 Tax=Arthrobacter sp. RAF14 TaxID=3233051 RepID=UPI003F91A159
MSAFEAAALPDEESYEWHSNDLTNGLLLVANDEHVFRRFDWGTLGLKPLQIANLLLWMKQRNRIEFGDWNQNLLIQGKLPPSIALTSGEYKRLMANQQGRSHIFFEGPVHAPVNIGGFQAISGGDLSLNLYQQVAEAIREDAALASQEERAEADEVALVFEEAAAGRLDTGSFHFKAARHWVAERVNAATGSALGTGLWTATTVIAKHLGWT